MSSDDEIQITLEDSRGNQRDIITPKARRARAPKKMREKRKAAHAWIHALKVCGYLQKGAFKPVPCKGTHKYAHVKEVFERMRKE